MTWNLNWETIIPKFRIKNNVSNRELISNLKFLNSFNHRSDGSFVVEFAEGGKYVP